jgi:hypothetical protein
MIFQKCCGVWICDEGNSSTVTTISSIGTGKRFELLTLYRDAAIATVTGTKVQSNLINECHHELLLSL